MEITGEPNSTEHMPKTANPEIPKDGDWETMIVLHRHSAYNSGRPVDWDHPTAEEAKVLGRLTEDSVDSEGQLKKGGRTLATERARERLEAILAEDPGNIDFLIVSSPTFWLDRPEFGQRARETADIVTEEIKRQLEEKGLSDNQILNTQPAPTGAEESRTTRFRTEPTAQESIAKIDAKLRESQIFQPQFRLYVNFMREKYHGQGREFWRARNADVDRDERLKVGAPGPEDDARDINTVVSSEARYARLWHQNPTNKGRRLVVWDVTHGDGAEPYLQRVVGVNQEDFEAGYNDGVAIAIKRGDVNGTVSVAGDIHGVPISKHGNSLLPLKRVADSQGVINR